MKLSVAFICYNQAQYVREALESVLAQQADFDWEIVIADDCSTDGTAQIIAEHVERYPGRLRVLPRPRNLGAVANVLDLYAACHGEYLAPLEGDDFWTSPEKIRRQVEFLDAHPDCTVCYHPANMIYEDGRPSHCYPDPPRPPRSTIDDLLVENFMATSSVMLRRSALPTPLPGFLSRLTFLDLPINVLAADKGYIGQISGQMATYRIHPGGIWSGKHAEARALAVIEVIQSLDEYLEHRYHAAIRELVLHLYDGICTYRRLRLEASEAASLRWVRDYGGLGWLRSKAAIRTVLSIYVPWILRAVRRIRRLPRPPATLD